MALSTRFWSKVQVGPIPPTFWDPVTRTHHHQPDVGHCWLWTAGTDDRGYGVYCLVATVEGRRFQRAHIAAYEAECGPVPDGQELDHLCRIHGCVRRSHLEAVPHGENLARGAAPSQVAHRTGVCVAGLHALEGANVYVNPNGRGVECRACRNERSRRYHEAQR